MVMSAETLATVSRAATRAARAASGRDFAIREAHAAGHSVRAIASAAGISFQRVHQIVTAETRCKPR